MGQSKYTVTLDDKKVVDGIGNASNSEGVSRKEFVEQAVTDYLLAGPRTKALQKERAELRNKCEELLKDRKRLYSRNDELAEERDKVAEQKANLEIKFESSKHDSDRISKRNDELAEERDDIAEKHDKLVEQNSILEGKVAMLAGELESLVEEVKDAQNAGFFGSGKAVRAINVYKYSYQNEEADVEKT